jgi:hypothetical protein
MLRFRILASAVPLIAAAMFAQGGILPDSRPCIAIDGVSVQMAAAPWQARLQVSFTNDPNAATVRVQISDSAEAADFVVVDDEESADTDACKVSSATRFIGVSTSPSASTPVIYLTSEGPADYRIFVRSKTFSVRDAAALIVGASGKHRPLEAASL